MDQRHSEGGEGILEAEGIFLKQDKGGGRREGGRDPVGSLHPTPEMEGEGPSQHPLQARGSRKRKV